MFRSTGGPKNPFTQRLYQPGQLLDVLTVDSLLDGIHHQHWISKIHQMLDLPSDYGSVLTQDLIDNMVEFVQVLPNEMNQPLSSMMNKALTRAYFMAEHVRSQTLRKENRTLFTYAAFSAGLMQDLAKVVLNYKVFVTSKKGVFQSAWNPFLGPMTELGDYYVIRPVFNNALRGVTANITTMLARQIMPEIAFNWLSSDEIVFADWLQVLSGKTDAMGVIGSGLSYYQHDLTQEQLREADLPVVEANPTDLAETALAEEFLRWLHDKVRDGKLNVGTASSAVHLIDQGVFLETEKLFADFAKENASLETHKTLEGQLKGMFGAEHRDGVITETALHYGVTTDVIGQTAGQVSSGIANIYGNSLRNKAEDMRIGFALGDPNVLLLNVGGSTILSSIEAKKRPAQLPNLQKQSVVSPNTRKK